MRFSFRLLLLCAHLPWIAHGSPCSQPLSHLYCHHLSLYSSVDLHQHRQWKRRRSCPVKALYRLLYARITSANTFSRGSASPGSELHGDLISDGMTERSTGKPCSENPGVSRRILSACCSIDRLIARPVLSTCSSSVEGLIRLLPSRPSILLIWKALFR